MNNELEKFSLIYPNEATQIAHYEAKDKPQIDMYVLEELGLLEIFNLKNSDLDEYFTTDVEVIKYRMEKRKLSANTDDYVKLLYINSETKELIYPEEKPQKAEEEQVESSEKKEE